MPVQCPRCKEKVEGLVKKYGQINKTTGKAQTIEVEKAVCENCIVDVFYEIVEKRNDEQ
jgi:hypothetical protein